MRRAAGEETPSLACLLDAAESARRSGQLAEARGGFMDLAVAAEREGDDAALVAAGLGVGGLWVHEQRDVVARASVHSLWQRAKAAAPPDSLERARLAVRESAEAVYEGAPIDDVFTAVEQVRSFQDPASTAEALSLMHHVQLGPGHGARRLELAEEMIALAARADDSLLVLMGLCWRVVDLFLAGDPRGHQSLTELRERSAAGGCAAVSFIVEVLDAMLLARAGRLDDAEQGAAAALESGTAVGDPDAPAYFGAMIATLRWWQGRGEEVVPLVRTLAISPRLGLNDHVYVAAAALLAATTGDREAAEEALARLSGIGLEQLPDSSSWLATQFLAIEASYVLGETETASRASELLRPYARLPVMPSLAVVCLGSAERGLGLAAAVTGQLDEAVEHLAAALRADRALGSRPMAVMTEHTLAAILGERGKPGDKTRAEQSVNRAEEQASRMGMKLPPHPIWLQAGPAARRRWQTRLVSLERGAQGWRVTLDGEAVLVPDLVGVSYLAELLSRPGEDLDVLELASRARFGSKLSPEPILDDSALRSYRRRIRELNALLDGGDLAPGKANQQREELAALTDALRSATGLRGRPRTFLGDHERARTAVRKALVRGVGTLGAAHPELGEHLRRSVFTGARCRYTAEAAWSIAVLRRGV